MTNKKEIEELILKNGNVVLRCNAQYFKETKGRFELRQKFDNELIKRFNKSNILFIGYTGEPHILYVN